MGIFFLYILSGSVGVERTNIRCMKYGALDVKAALSAKWVLPFLSRHVSVSKKFEVEVDIRYG